GPPRVLRSAAPRAETRGACAPGPAASRLPPQGRRWRMRRCSPAPAIVPAGSPRRGVDGERWIPTARSVYRLVRLHRCRSTERSVRYRSAATPPRRAPRPVRAAMRAVWRAPRSPQTARHHRAATASRAAARARTDCARPPVRDRPRRGTAGERGRAYSEQPDLETQRASGLWQSALIVECGIRRVVERERDLASREQPAPAQVEAP